MLGSQTGSVHHQRQGTGKATVLGPSQAIKDFTILDDKRQAGLAARRQAAAEAVKAMKDFNPERWLRHDRELKDGLNTWVSEGAKLMSSGLNPAAGVDDESVQWRNKKARIEAKAKSSMQMKQMFEATRAKIDGSEPDKYSDESLLQMKQYFETPLDEIVDGGILPPPLLQRKPSANLQKSWAGLTKDLYDRNGKKPLDEAGKWDFVTASMANDPDVVDASVSYLAQLPKAEQDRYKQRAQETGKSEIELVNYDFLERYSPGREPFNLDQHIQKAADAIDVPYAQSSSPDKFGTYVKTKDFQKIADTKAAQSLVDPQALNSYQSLLPMKDGEDEGAYRARAVADLSKRLRALKATKTESGTTDSGQGKADLQVSAEAWLRDVKSGVPDRTERASRFLFETKGVLGNMNVVMATIDPTLQYDDQLKKAAPTMVVELRGNPSLREVKEQLVELGIPTESVSLETVGTSSRIRIPVHDDTENALLRLHDKAFKAGSRQYDPTPLKWSADDIIKQGPPAAAGSKAKF